MSVDVYYEDFDEAKHRMCVCGHELGDHAFTGQMNYSTKEPYVRVNQCVFCDCKEFKNA